MGDLSENLNRYEFSCKCGCGFDDVDDYHVEQLQEVRNVTGIRMVINSGCRCVEHNEAVGGSYDSDHISGEGSDIAVSSSRDRFRLVEAAIKVGISRIGIAKTFVHFGTSLTKTQEVIWVY